MSMLRKKTRAKTIAIAFTILSAGSAFATVIEFQIDGTPKSQTNKIQNDLLNVNAITPPSNLFRQAQTGKYQQLAANVALTYANEFGVRNAGLTAQSFVKVFLALIARESAFDPEAVSPKGAQGLGQLMPGTASDMRVLDPFDPKQNLNGSAKYLTDLLAEFGSLELALAAYNAGPQRVRDYKGIPPFPETRAYVAWILEKSDAELTNAETVNIALPSNNAKNTEPTRRDVSVWEF